MSSTWGNNEKEFAAVQHSAASQIARITEKALADRAKFDLKLKEYFRITESLKAQRDEAIREQEVWKQRALRDAAEVNAVKQAHEETKVQLSTMVERDVYESVCVELADAKCTIEQLRAEIVPLQAEIDRLNAMVQERDARIVELEKVVADLLKQIKDLEYRLDNLEVIQKQELAQAAQVLTETKAKHETDVAAMDCELRELRQRVQDLLSEKEMLRAQIAELNALLHKERLQHEAELAEALERESVAISAQQSAEVVARDAVERRAEIEQKLHNIEQGCQGLYDDLENALKSATELRNPVPSSEGLDPECRYGAWVGLYRSVARTLRTKFNINREFRSPGKVIGSNPTCAALLQSPH